MPLRTVIQGLSIFVLMFILFLLNTAFVEWQIITAERRNEYYHNKSMSDRERLGETQKKILDRLEKLEGYNESTTKKEK